MMRHFFSILLCFLSFLHGPCHAWGAEEAPPPELTFVEARVADASDRAYEPAAIRLIDHAERSVAMSMYLVRESEDERHPVNRLLNDLVEAARRGVRVELYLNTRFKGGDPAKILETPALNRLRAAGGQVTGLPAHRRLHDKLLIVDERYILEGSTNWSISALMANWESNTLIDSPPLAKQKLRRVRQMIDVLELAHMKETTDISGKDLCFYRVITSDYFKIPTSDILKFICYVRSKKQSLRSRNKPCGITLFSEFITEFDIKTYDEIKAKYFIPHFTNLSSILRSMSLLGIVILISIQMGWSAYILLPMDAQGQRNHLKAYGVTFWVLEQDVEAYWLLNYRGGSFAFPHNTVFEKECKTRDVSYEVIPDVQFASIRESIAAKDVNQEAIKF